MELINNIIASFVLGLATPLTAVCVLPLYPGFLSFLANQISQSKEGEVSKKDYALFGLLITIGILIFMTILGLLFTTILQASLTNVIGIISPIAFSIMGIISIFLIFNVDITKVLPKFVPKTNASNPKVAALLYGFFFGAIVIPCNPAFIATFFARALLFENFTSSMLNFIFFGLGIGFPLLIFSILSTKWSNKIIFTLTKHKTVINRLTGVILLIISFYYVTCVFSIIPLNSICSIP